MVFERQLLPPHTYWCILIITVIIIQTKEAFCSFNIFKQLSPSLSSWTAFLKLGAYRICYLFWNEYFRCGNAYDWVILVRNYCQASPSSYELRFLLYMTPLSLAWQWLLRSDSKLVQTVSIMQKQYGRLNWISPCLCFIIFDSFSTSWWSKLLLFIRQMQSSSISKEFLTCDFISNLPDAICNPCKRTCVL